MTYVELGKTLTLNVTYQTNSKVTVTWIKDRKNLYTTVFGSTDPRVSIKGQATLVLINTTLSDNGIYKNIFGTAITTNDINNLIVIVQGMYTVIAVSFPYSITYLSYVINYLQEINTCKRNSTSTCSKNHLETS